MFQVSRFPLFPARHYPCGTGSALFGLHGATRALPEHNVIPSIPLQKQFWLYLKKTQRRRGGKIGVNPPFVRCSGIVRATPAEVLPLVLTLVPAHKYILVSSSHIVSPGQVGFVEWDRSWCSWIDSWRCHWASFAAFHCSTHCSAFVKPRANLNSVSVCHKLLFVINNKESFFCIDSSSLWWSTFSLSQTSSLDSRTKCRFSSSRKALRPCWLWKETMAHPYLMC